MKSKKIYMIFSNLAGFYEKVIPLKRCDEGKFWFNDEEDFCEENIKDSNKNGMLRLFFDDKKEAEKIFQYLNMYRAHVKEKI